MPSSVPIPWTVETPRKSELYYKGSSDTRLTEALGTSCCTLGAVGWEGAEISVDIPANTQW